MKQNNIQFIQKYFNFIKEQNPDIDAQDLIFHFEQNINLIPESYNIIHMDSFIQEDQVIYSFIFYSSKFISGSALANHQMESIRTYLMKTYDENIQATTVEIADNLVQATLVITF